MLKCFEDPLTTSCDANHLHVSLSLQQIACRSEKQSLTVLMYLSSCLVQYCTPWITPRDPYEVPLVMLEVLSRKVMALGEKAELLDTYCRLKSAVRVVCHFKMNESNVRIIVKKKKRKGNPWSRQSGYTSKLRNLALLAKHLYLMLKMQLLCGCKIMIRQAHLQINMIREKAKSSCDKGKGRGMI